MKITKLALVLILCNTLFVVKAQDENTLIVTEYNDFEPGNEERMYGDRVVLRKDPDSESKALDTLAIGAKVTIVKMMDETKEVNGLESHWYKVKHAGKSGYVLGGFIALDHRTLGDDTFLVIYAAGPTEYNRNVRCRVLNASGNYYGHEITLFNSSFFLETFEDRGISGIKNMLCINLFAEACGVDGGEVYLFNDGERLVKALELTNVVDGGAFWYNETATFPEDGYWGDDVVYFEREFGESVDEELNLTRAVTYSLTLTWKDGAFDPPLESIDFEQIEKRMLNNEN